MPRGTRAAWGGLLQPAPADGAVCACRLPILRELAQGTVPEPWLASGLGLVLKGPVSSHLASQHEDLLLHAVVMFPVAAAAASAGAVSHWD